LSINIPDFLQIRTQVANKYNRVFGDDLNTSPNSPTGEIIDEISNSYLQLFQLAQAVDLSALANQSQGQTLDDLLSLINVSRPVGTQTIIPNVTLSGTEGTIIPAGSLAKTSSGNIFYSASDVELNEFGTGLTDFYAQELGAIVVAQHELNTIVTEIDGWEDVLNGSAGFTGSDTFKDSQLRRRLPQLVNQYSLGYQGAIRARVFQNTAVIDVEIIENDTFEPLPPPYESPAHSLWLIIYYKDETQEQDIADSIFLSKSAVGVYSENNARQVIKTSNDINGRPHQISWNKAQELALFVTVTITATSQLTTNVVELIKETLSNYINESPKIGHTLYYNRFLCSIADIDDEIQVESLWVTTTPPPNDTNIVDIVPQFYEVFTLNKDDVEVILS
jgi:hypothetical protein